MQCSTIFTFCLSSLELVMAQSGTLGQKCTAATCSLGGTPQSDSIDRDSTLTLTQSEGVLHNHDADKCQ
jgi:hypothetical protein